MADTRTGEWRRNRDFAYATAHGEFHQIRSWTVGVCRVDYGSRELMAWVILAVSYRRHNQQRCKAGNVECSFHGRPNCSRIARNSSIRKGGLFLCIIAWQFGNPGTDGMFTEPLVSNEKSPSGRSTSGAHVIPVVGLLSHYADSKSASAM